MQNLFATTHSQKHQKMQSTSTERGIGFRKPSECGLPSSLPPSVGPSHRRLRSFPRGCESEHTHCRALPAGLVPLPLVRTVSHYDAARARWEFCRLPCFCPIQPQYSASAPAIVDAAGTRLVLIHRHPGTICSRQSNINVSSLSLLWQQTTWQQQQPESASEPEDPQVPDNVYCMHLS
ncbi:hypothetical protein V8C34DRAFT_266390 [Trichoderma compactum]